MWYIGAAWRQLSLEAEVYRVAQSHGFRIEQEAEVYRVAQSHGFRIEQIVEAEYIRQQAIDSRVLVIRR